MEITTDNIKITNEQTRLISSAQAWHYNIIPKERTLKKIVIYVGQDNFTDTLLQELEMLFDCMVETLAVPDIYISQALNTYYRTNQDRQHKTYTGSSDSFLVDIIAEAKSLRSSDIHIEVYDQRCRVRIRIDGMLVERYTLEKPDYPGIINKIKIMSNLDIAEKRLPQDGRIFFRHEDQKFDIRVSVLPTLHGEKVVMRLLGNDATDIDIHKLGFSTNDLQNYLEGIKRPNGILLISGPTGSGKTTTLYATLKLLNKEHRNIITVEDPIEYTLEGINQVQLKESIGLTFAGALRSFLRQDPDVIMVGEIRDKETAEMAVRASLTGHLVLSTIHTNSAWGTISRLIDMGVPPFLVAGTLNTSVAQRLIRKLCPTCKQTAEFNDGLFPPGFSPYAPVGKYFVPKGCEECHYTGYRGRIAVYEIIPIDVELAACIKNGRTTINDLLKIRNINTLSENAFTIFINGETSIEEIYPLLTNN